MNIKRLERVRLAMAEASLTQLAVTDPASIFYMTGVRLDPQERLLALLIPAAGDMRLIVNRLFMVPQLDGTVICWYGDTDDPVSLLASYCEKDKPLGVDKNMAARFLLRLMELGAAAGYINGSRCIDGARALKDGTEATFMRKASQINDRTMAELPRYIKAGMTEEDLRQCVLRLYREYGAEGASFDPLIAFGANAADGHHGPDGTKLRAGDCIIIDIGCRASGYCSDMTRTFFLGSAPDKLREIYEIVRHAGDAARALVRPGVRLCDLDGAARRIIEDAGYGAYFTHRLGHFIGIEVHEAGDVSGSNTAVCEEGMVFSIEPGIYLPGVGGVRIEDLVLVTPSCCEVLNTAPRELTVLPV
jgi:Xaa-Pro dipeptidase